MERRRFLGASTAALLAGCGDIQNRSEGSDTEQNKTDSVGGQTESQIDGDAEIIIDDSEWMENRSAVEFVIGNEGTEPSGPLHLTFSWYDGSGNYIGQDTVSIGSLIDGRNWQGAVQPQTPFDAQSYEISLQFDAARTPPSDRVELLEHEVTEDEQAIVGRVENLSEESATIQGEASTYNSAWLSHTGSVIDRNVPAGSTWRFRLPLTRVDHTVEEVGDQVDIRFVSGEL